MSATVAMEVNAEARRILAVSISKLYASRTQRGGLRLHRSLLLSLVMRSARDIYHSSRESEGPTAEEPMDTSSSPGEEEQQQQAAVVPEPQPALISSEESLDSLDEETTEDKENRSPARQSRKRRGKASAAPDFLPIKRARLEPGEERYAAPAGQLSSRGRGLPRRFVSKSGYTCLLNRWREKIASNGTRQRSDSRLLVNL